MHIPKMGSVGPTLGLPRFGLDRVGNPLAPLAGSGQLCEPFDTTRSRQRPSCANWKPSRPGAANGAAAGCDPNARARGEWLHDIMVPSDNSTDTRAVSPAPSSSFAPTPGMAASSSVTRLCDEGQDLSGHLSGRPD
jgi:hypothetical protein